MTKERPILFSGPLVRALLEGRKSVTRRPVKPQPVEGRHGTVNQGMWGFRISSNCESWTNHEFPPAGFKCPFGKPMDRLWVREAWMPADRLVDSVTRDPPQWIRYRADGAVLGRYAVDDPLTGPGDEAMTAALAEAPMPAKGWRPSIHMFRWASRITLEITAVGCERVQDITPEQAVAEGMPGPTGALQSIQEYPPGSIATRQFREAWDAMYAKSPGLQWAANPWVWAVSFNLQESR